MLCKLKIPGAGNQAFKISLFQQNLEKYAEVFVKVGLNIQPAKR